jgi:hypothetical protein
MLSQSNSETKCLKTLMSLSELANCALSFKLNLYWLCLVWCADVVMSVPWQAKAKLVTYGCKCSSQSVRQIDVNQSHQHWQVSHVELCVWLLKFLFCHPSDCGIFSLNVFCISLMYNFVVFFAYDSAFDRCNGLKVCWPVAACIETVFVNDNLSEMQSICTWISAVSFCSLHSAQQFPDLSCIACIFIQRSAM